MTTNAIEQALLAIMAASGGDWATADAHLSRAQEDARGGARRDRQIVEVATLVVAGHGARAAGLALEHAAEFPDDAGLMARVAGTAP